MRERIHAAVGQSVMALSVAPRNRHQTLTDLRSLVLEPLIRDRITIASANGTEDTPEESGALAGIAFWAAVEGATG